MVAGEKVTREGFSKFAELPENADRVFELINGEIVEKMPGTTRNSAIPMNLAGVVRPYCRQHNIPCFMTGEQGSYNVRGEVFAPDFAYKQTPTTAEYPDPVPPLWVLEVVSPNDKPRDVRNKRQVYLDAGILYWEVYPEDNLVDVYIADQHMSYRADDVIDLGDLIPGFKLPVRELFGG